MQKLWEKMLKKISFILSLVGIAFLIGLFLSSPIELDDIDELEINEKVVLTGEVENERDFGDFKIWSVEGVTAVCNCKESYLGEEVRVVGIVDVYGGEKQVRVLEISVI